MYPVISYTIYITTCVVISMFLLLQKRKDHFVSFCYFRMMRLVALILLVSVPEHILLLLGHTYALDGDTYGTFLLPFIQVIYIGLFLTIFSTYFTLYNKWMRLQRQLMWLFIALGALHPILFTNYCGHNYEDLTSLQDSYLTYMGTSQFRIYAICCMLLGAVYLAVCLFTTCRFVYRIMRWYADPSKREGLSFGIRLIAIMALYFILVIISYVIGYIYNIEYHADLPLWALFLTLMNIMLLNEKEKYVLFIRTYVRLEMLESTARKLTPESNSKEMSKDSLHQREQMVVLRTLQDWAERDDSPFMAKGFTLSTLSDETAIPEAVLAKYINSEFGLYFDNYIDYLKERRQDAQMF